ncbi:MAG: hypothetical protein NVS3B26_23650 [Mycobacteriales bacterium]
MPISPPVRLLGLPVRLFEAAAEQWDGMLREYALRAIAGGTQPYDLDEIGRAGAALASVEAAVGDVRATDSTPWRERLTVEVKPERPGDFAVLQGVLDDVCHLASTGELLVLPPLPEVVGLRDWLCGEVAEQHAGGPATPWRLDAVADDPADTAAAEWNPSLAPGQQDAWLVGDDRNRVVAASVAALQLLGWTEDDLVGQRLLVVIPERLREAHVAGFTRSVVTGSGALLGQPLELPALSRAGVEIPSLLTLTRHAARAGRHVYLARLEPVQPSVIPTAS